MAFVATMCWWRFLPPSFDRSDKLEEQEHRRWARTTRQAFDARALPGGYPNLLAGGDADRVANSYGRNVERLIKAKRRYDPENVFCSAIPLPIRKENDRRNRVLLNVQR